MKTKVKEASVEKSTSGKMNGAMMLVEAPEGRECRSHFWVSGRRCASDL